MALETLFSSGRGEMCDVIQCLMKKGGTKKDIERDGEREREEEVKEEAEKGEEERETVKQRENNKGGRKQLEKEEKESDTERKREQGKECHSDIERYVEKHTQGQKETMTNIERSPNKSQCRLFLRLSITIGRTLYVQYGHFDLTLVDTIDVQWCSISGDTIVRNALGLQI